MSEAFDRLTAIMARLRGEGGCPWDREQTHESLKPYLIEETYETIEAIDSGDPAHLREELGDLLLQIVFHAQMARERGEFTMEEVARGICEKLERRHPHVFANGRAENSGEVIRNWEKIKLEEKKDAPRASILDGVPRGMPALLRARRIQGRASHAGFDWDAVDGALAKAEEELNEFIHVAREGNPARMEDEFGDLLFSLVNVARFFSINPEAALTRATDKFTTRFKAVERRLAAAGKTPADSTLEEMDALWNEVKDERP